MTPTIPADTLARQLRASAPGASAWVSANAGSGKTHVLTQRVIRLLLSGVAPSRILCVTFTKAAAANMSIRIFRDLAAWTVLDDAGLVEAIRSTGAPEPGSADLDLARRLFARTVETPGGLKVQTIHAFCERLLHLFPFEANVPARFEVLADMRGADLLARAREAALAEAQVGHDSALAEALAFLGREIATETFDKLLREALGHREALRASRTSDLARQIAKTLGLAPGATVAAVEQQIVEGGIAPSEWTAVARRLGADGTGKTTGDRLAQAAAAPPAMRCDAYMDVFLTKAKPRDDRYLVKSLRMAEPDLCARLDDERDRLAPLAERRRAARLAEATVALLTVAAAILRHYAAAKGVRGLLDFDDLIERTRTLLKRSDAPWVLYKLDSGIDHILVDEAQDTSPEQWEILNAIGADFFTGEGVPRAPRTFFAVGDEKQSIYSFQGARPDMFDRMRRRFGVAAGNAEQDFEDVRLLLSFRSARAVLRTVDQVFAHPPNAVGLTSDADGPPPHEALRQFPGTVEIWPVVMPAPHEEPRDWRLPVDAVDANEPPVVLARRIGEAIARWTAPGSAETVQDGEARRSMRPGDVLILLRTRNAFFEAVIRALKERSVAVAGADRLALTEHIAVMDLVAAGRTAISPDDDFTLACVLKSPLIGLDDDDLILLAPPRTGTLLAALEASAKPHHRRAAEALAAWRRRAGRATPFGFYTQLLSADGGRRALLGRLGPEAGDAIDEFLALTLAHERDSTPSLLGFLARLDGADLSIKRDMEATGDAVRVMTVHAAKGLEAKVVILPDTCDVPTGRHDPRLFGLGDAPPEDNVLVWSPKTDADAGPLGAARVQARQRAVEEHHRLLYVAMTRAEERLYVTGFCGDKGPAEGSWYRMIGDAGLDLSPVPAFWDPEETVLRYSDGPAATPNVVPGDAARRLGAQDIPASVSPDESRISTLALPAWLTRPPEPEADPAMPPVRPSNPLGAADQLAPFAWSFGERRRSGRRLGLAAGRLTHALLQHLPDVEPGRRRAVAERFLAARGAGIEPEHRTAIVDQVLGAIADPALAALFSPGSRAEVAVAATVVLAPGRSIEVVGQIDRIAVTSEAVHIADFKTGRPAELATPQHRLQLALYRAAVAPLYPGRTIRAYLVWTTGPRVVEISGGDLDAALSALSAVSGA